MMMPRMPPTVKTQNGPKRCLRQRGLQRRPPQNHDDQEEGLAEDNVGDGAWISAKAPHSPCHPEPGEEDARVADHAHDHQTSRSSRCGSSPAQRILVELRQEVDQVLGVVLLGRLSSTFRRTCHRAPRGTLRLSASSSRAQTWPPNSTWWISFSGPRCCRAPSPGLRVERAGPALPRRTPLSCRAPGATNRQRP